MEITGLPQTGVGAAASSAASFSEDFDNFLLLLTTQLQHQDPLSPMDTNEFTSQLVQFTGVEQAIRTNQNLEQLIALQSGAQAVAAVSFLGKTIEAFGNQLWLSGGSSEITYELGGAAAASSIVILDGNGKPVRTLSGEIAAGPHRFVWNGTDNDGNALPDGVYSVQVTAIDAEGNDIGVVTGVVGKVDGVQNLAGTILLKIGDLAIPLGNVHTIREPVAGAA
jgi:flagellar basal-body rod modification protein FlgD